MILFAAILGIPFGAFARSRSEVLFRKATDAYKEADYQSAADAFLQSALARPASGTYQNLGLAQWQRSEVGRAVLAWEQSLWLDPFNQAARKNLRFARKAAQIEAPDYSWAEVISTWLPVNWWGWIVASSLWLAVGASTLPSVLRSPKAAWHQALAALGLMLFLLSLPAQYGVHTRSRLGFVVEKGTLLRLTPTSNAQTIAQLPSGEPVRWLRTRGNFLLVRTSRSSGWVEKRQLSFLCEQTK